MDYFSDELQGPYRTAAKTILGVSAVCSVAALGLLVSTLAGRPATRTVGGAVAWYWLVPTTLLLVATNVFNMYAAATDVRAGRIMDQDYAFPSTHDGWAAAGVILPELFLMFELVALRVVWHVGVAGPLAATKSRTKSLWTFRVLDVCLLLGMLVTSVATSSISEWYGMCWEATCGNAVQYSIMGHYNTLAASFFFIIFPCCHLIVAAVAILLAPRWLPRSPLARAMARLVSPIVLLQLVLYIVAIATAFVVSGDWGASRSMYKVYYAAIPFFLSQPVLLALLQHAQRTAPAQSAAEVADAGHPFGLVPTDKEGGTVV